jgi:hypothetical protein
MKFGFTMAVAALCAVGFAQFSDNFESESASAAGTLITGQNGWYLPAVTGSLDGFVYTYANNALGHIGNATGGNNFAGASSINGGTPVRMQHALTLNATGLWRLSVDFNFDFSGTPPVANNLGSISLQPTATNNAFQTLYAFDNLNLAAPTGYRALYGFAGAAGGAIALESNPGDARWDNLIFNHWYHQTLTWDAGSNQIVETTLQDMTAGGPLNTLTPTTWFLTGGQNNVLQEALATDTRLFVSGGNLGVPPGLTTNLGGYDNFSIAPVPEPASMAVLGLGALALLRRRRKA